MRYINKLYLIDDYDIDAHK